MLSPVERFEDDESDTAALVGVDVVAHVFLYLKIVVTRLRIVTVTMYRYGATDDVARFIRNAEHVCRTLKVSTSTMPP